MITLNFRHDGRPAGKCINRNLIIMKGRHVWSLDTPLVRLIGVSPTEPPKELVLTPDWVTQGAKRTYYGHRYPIPRGHYKVGSFLFFYDGIVHCVTKHHVFGETTNLALRKRRKSRRKLATPQPLPFLEENSSLDA